MSEAGSTSGSTPVDVDVVVVGAGFSGLYLLHRLRQLGLSARAFDAAGDVGGTWYWNRYPGARCDIPTTDYTLTFDPELEHAWTWSEKYATQPEILRYAQFLAERYDLRKDITFSTRVEGAVWDDASGTWSVRTEQGEQVTCRFYVMASGCLSVPKAPDVNGADRFRGDVYYTSTLAARGRRLHRQAGRRDRHRLVRHPVDPADRRAGRAADRLPAHGQLLDPGAQRPRPAGPAGRDRRRPRDLPRGGQVVQGRHPVRDQRDRRRHGS